jgi:hypothetical protein
MVVLAYICTSDGAEQNWSWRMPFKIFDCVGFLCKNQSIDTNSEFTSLKLLIKPTLKSGYFIVLSNSAICLLCSYRCLNSYFDLPCCTAGFQSHDWCYLLYQDGPVRKRGGMLCNISDNLIILELYSWYGILTAVNGYLWSAPGEICQAVHSGCVGNSIVV